MTFLYLSCILFEIKYHRTSYFFRVTSVGIMESVLLHSFFFKSVISTHRLLYKDPCVALLLFHALMQLVKNAAAVKCIKSCKYIWIVYFRNCWSLRIFEYNAFTHIFSLFLHKLPEILLVRTPSAFQTCQIHPDVILLVVVIITWNPLAPVV